ncbi:MAG: hypothetical protein HOO99_04025 [Hyphomicrobiaceae bacterium]|nr:hypothetical protein [Hyphomicrobiaceae bacterium]
MTSTATADAIFDTSNAAEVGPLITLSDKDAYAVFTGGEDAIKPTLHLIKEKIDAFAGDITTPAGRKAIASFAYSITRSKTHIDDVGKKLTDVAKEIPKKIDANRKFARDTLDKWKEDVRAPLTAWEAEQKKRDDNIKGQLQEWQSLLTDAAERSSEVIRDRLAEVEAVELIEDNFGDYLEAAIEIRGEAVSSLKAKLDSAIKREQDAAELAELRKLRADIDAQKKKEADAERDEVLRQEGVRAAEARAEAQLAKERQEAAKREQELKDIADRAEQKARDELAAKQKREADEQAKREADKNHRAAVNRSAMEAFVAAGIATKAARTAVELIVRGEVPNVSINY